MPDSSPVDPRRTALRRMQHLAGAMLVLAIAGLVLSEWQGGQGGWAWVKAFCEAAAIGALADWFAVVALFRRPLGLPIPHTAIIPESRDRIADNLAAFVRDHFLAPETLLDKLAAADPASRLAEWLQDEGNTQRLTATLQAAVTEGLDLLDDAAVQGLIERHVSGLIERWDAADTGGRVLDLLTQDGRHHELLDTALIHTGEYLQQPQVKEQLAELIQKFARKEWPKIVAVVGWVKSTDEMADRYALKLTDAVIDELGAVLSQGDHPLRTRYNAWLAEFIQRLKHEPELRAQVNALKDQALQAPSLRRYVAGLWLEVKGWLGRELRGADSPLAQQLNRGLLRLGTELAQDPALREAINRHVMSVAARMAASMRDTVTGHISQTIKGWETRHLVEQIELGVGRDLQFIRLNGTLVGGLIGLALHALLVVVGGFSH